MPKGINPDDVVKAALKLLNANKSKVSGVVDDAVGAIHPKVVVAKIHLLLAL
jgi:hypothetical protein